MENFLPQHPPHGEPALLREARLTLAGLYDLSPHRALFQTCHGRPRGATGGLGPCLPFSVPTPSSL